MIRPKYQQQCTISRHLLLYAQNEWSQSAPIPRISPCHTQSRTTNLIWSMLQKNKPTKCISITYSIERFIPAGYPCCTTHLRLGMEWLLRNGKLAICFHVPDFDSVGSFWTSDQYRDSAFGIWSLAYPHSQAVFH
jgi:hypothetical protein